MEQLTNGALAGPSFMKPLPQKLLDYRNNRAALVAGIRDIAGRAEGLGYLTEDKYVDGTTGFVRDICPFTTMGMINRGITNENRKIIAAELAKFLGVTIPVPDSFEGIPVLNNMKSWYFGYENVRSADHIDALWNVFAAGLRYADTDDAKARDEFSTAFDNANGRRGVAWNLTFGLYWARPWIFLSLDNNSQAYITNSLGIAIGRHGPKRRCNAADYLATMDTLESKFEDESYPVHSFPELSLVAWTDKGSDASPADPEEEDGDDHPSDSAMPAGGDVPADPYSIDDIVVEGCFLDRDELDRLISSAAQQEESHPAGSPRHGKDLAGKAAGVCLGRAARSPQGQSSSSFTRICPMRISCAAGAHRAMASCHWWMARSWKPWKRHGQRHSPTLSLLKRYNRGNPAQVFGEMLTLLEADKRSPHEALELCYRRKADERVFIPDNLYVIGTMNIADRSLALVDLALRRRFAFVDLEPRLGSAWREWLTGRCGLSADFVGEIELRIAKLNETITEDPTLGRQFRIGHSYVTPRIGSIDGDQKEWFKQVVLTEIGPLLDEYWFDALDKARTARQRLIEGL